MSRQEILLMLNILKKAYPSFYRNLTKQEAEDTVVLYEEMFKDCDSRIVLHAVKELINTNEYPPTIASIKEKMYQMTHTNESSDSELWDILVKAIGRSGYYAEEEFNKLPSIIKEFVKSPYQLQELSQMPSDTIHSVVKGQFLRQIENLKQRVKEKDMMLPETRKLLYGDENIIDETIKMIEEL